MGFGYAKLIGAAAVCLTIYFGYLYVVNLQEDNAHLGKENTKLTISNDSLKVELDDIKKEAKELKKISIETNKKFNKIAQDKQRLISLFGNHNFDRLLNKKPGLITKRMKAATKKKFKEIEGIVNE